MENLFQKLQSLKGATLDEETIAQLIAAAARSEQSISSDVKHVTGAEVDNQHVDDIVVAQRAAEMELESMRRYFQTPDANRRRGVDGLQDEILSSDSEDDIVSQCMKSEKSALDKLLSKNALVAIPDDECDEINDADDKEEVDLSHVPSTVVVPYGAQFIGLGTIQSVVDGLLVIGNFNPVEEPSPSDRRSSESVACDVESMVFLEGSDPLEVVGMIVDILGTVNNPLHLVIVSNKSVVSQLQAEGKLIGAKVCTLSSHSRRVEVDEFAGQLAIRGSPQLAELEDCDDDGADDDEADTIHTPPAVQVQARAFPPSNRQQPQQFQPRTQQYVYPPPPPHQYNVNTPYSFRR